MRWPIAVRVSRALQRVDDASAGPLMIVGTAGRKVLIWDLRKPAQPMQTRDSSLKYQTRCIAAFPDGSGYVLSSIEGTLS